MAELQALVFDVDGTLADTEEAHRRAFNEAFREAGLDWAWDEPLYKDLLAVTGGKERIRWFIERRLGTSPLGPGGDPDGLVVELHRGKTAHYTRMLAEGRVALRPGVLRLLREALDAGLRLAIATTTSPANVSALIENGMGGDAAGWFEVVGAGDVVPAKKPAADIYRWVLDRLGLPAEACAAFEDSRNGLLSARAAGIPCVVVCPSYYTAGEDFRGASLVLDQLGEPGAPCRVLRGPALEGGLLTVEDLRRLHRARGARAGGHAG